MKVYIPLNELGVNEFDNMVEESTNNLLIIKFDSTEYFYLENMKYLDFINVNCDTLIDLYEEEVIPNEKLKNALEITELLKNNSSDEKYNELLTRFIDIFKKAIDAGTFVGVYCYGEEKSFKK